MKRRVFTILWALSLLLFVAILALWADTGYLLGPRGHRSTRISTGDDYHYPETQYTFGVDSRALHLGREDLSSPPVPGPQLPANRMGTPEILAWQDSFGPLARWHWIGFSWASTPSVVTDEDDQLWMRGWQWHLRIPHWALLIVFAILPAWHLLSWRSRRRQARLRLGHCPTCNYDLRASQNRCPECGTPMPRAADPSIAQP